MKAWTFIAFDRETARSGRLRVPRWSLWLGLGALGVATALAAWAGYFLRASF